ncbi:putative DNA helicase (D10 protein) [Desulforapulum autotrophicum HRM2]|uniref:DNA helicase (D10 protein) n=1 Tax=Desulforapulum autotrophicum (strain ATCC 43914 / DSM 3382 / VKM B-1955 / HRM2) TaxID=177437 RepID=C0QGM8_DESAH|nr:DEAD/DEAH box helicase family protein [Desulforapulum autotrophicum]ACN13503.1 putative DNA helicase (D10 protein) [Desulforapulum autotrophicum HRM2]
MTDDRYNSLKKKYDELLEENEYLRAKIRKLESHPNPASYIKTSPVQSTQSEQQNGFHPELNSVDILINNAADDTSLINNFSSINEKIILFMSLFKGRNDVYAKKWQNKKGFSGYSPNCMNEWMPGICNKPRTKCSSCNQQRYFPLDKTAVEKHLRGEMIIGIYPMDLDDTCHFLAIDFDKDGWQKDISVLQETCSHFDLPIAIERSQSGNGCHAWFFFEDKVPAALARKFGSSLLTYSMNKRHEISFASYDRLFPNQDTMPKGGFGNLIALPLQKKVRDNGNSVFIDGDFVSYPDQWRFLSNIEKLNEKLLATFIKKLSKGNELGLLKDGDSKLKPWVKQTTELKKGDFSGTVKIVRSGMLYIKKNGLSQRALNTLKRYAAFKNPAFYKAQAMRISTYGKPRIISCADDFEDYLALPRGCEAEVIQTLDELKVIREIEDDTTSGKTVNVEFNGTLRDEQQEAIDALLAHDNGVLSAATAFGKTVIGAKLISIRKVNTLVLVHRQQLLSQWRERLDQFLTINETLPEPPKKRGRKKEQSLIGHMGAGKDRLSSIIDVAIMQSMNIGGNVKEAIKNYGMIIVDECHHLPAVTFEQILKHATAKYIYGLTATPSRPDGHHPIIFFYCGPVRFSVDAKKQAEKRPFEHYLIPRFTSFRIGSNKDDSEPTIQEIKSHLISDEIRNQLIVDDVVECYQKGRNILILTGRVAHVDDLGEMLRQRISNVICLKGGMGVKKTSIVMEELGSIPNTESFVLVATGSYIGEGFDEARLDTLFLAMPIAWKGTLQQYAGRLHRFSEHKKDVQIYDYVDIHVRMLEKMYGKRLKGYAAIGYKAKVELLPEAPTNIIFSKDNFFSVYLQDIAMASKRLLIVSPFVTKKRMLQMIEHFSAILKKRVEIIIITRPASDFKEDRRTSLEQIFKAVEETGVRLIFRSSIHQKFAIIDDKITWYGSINLLSFGYSEESIMRLESCSIAFELADSIKK